MSGDEVWTLRNERTGEIGILDPDSLLPKRLRRSGLKHPYHQTGRFAWYMVNSDDYAAVLRSLRGATVHVFAALPLLMGKDNILICRQKDICEATGLKAGTVSGAMKEIRHQMIVGQILGIERFSPEIAWKGYVHDLDEMRRLWRREKAGWIKRRMMEARH